MSNLEFQEVWGAFDEVVSGDDVSLPGLKPVSQRRPDALERLQRSISSGSFGLALYILAAAIVMNPAGWNLFAPLFVLPPVWLLLRPALGGDPFRFRPVLLLVHYLAMILILPGLPTVYWLSNINANNFEPARLAWYTQLSLEQATTPVGLVVLLLGPVLSLRLTEGADRRYPWLLVEPRSLKKWRVVSLCFWLFLGGCGVWVIHKIVRPTRELYSLRESLSQTDGYQAQLRGTNIQKFGSRFKDPWILTKVVPEFSYKQLKKTNLAYLARRILADYYDSSEGVLYQNDLDLKRALLRDAALERRKAKDESGVPDPYLAELALRTVIEDRKIGYLETGFYLRESLDEIILPYLSSEELTREAARKWESLLTDFPAPTGTALDNYDLTQVLIRSESYAAGIGQAELEREERRQLRLFGHVYSYSLPNLYLRWESRFYPVLYSHSDLKQYLGKSKLANRYRSFINRSMIPLRNQLEAYHKIQTLLKLRLHKFDTGKYPERSLHERTVRHYETSGGRATVEFYNGSWELP